MKNGNNNWGFTQIWNASILEREEREITKRDRIWASELGKSLVDIYLKMKGEKPTNPPNARSLRKFEAGNIWEWIVKLILLRAGILQSTQKWTGYQYPDLLEVSGKMDFVAGGKPDYEKGLSELKNLILPDIFLRAGKNILNYFKENYPDGLDEKILEIKSVSAFMFDNYESRKVASKNHRMQLFHYLKAENKEKGEIIYVCKDDCRMLEVPVINPSPVEDEYKGQIEKLTNYFKNDEQPPLEEPIVFDEDFGKFAKNWHFAYSLYLTKLYGFKDQNEFDEKYLPIVEKWNRVLGRIKEEKEMTDNNKMALEEIEKAGFDIEKIKMDIGLQLELEDEEDRSEKLKEVNKAFGTK